MINPGESQMPPYGQPPISGHGGQFPPQNHPGMMHMGPGMPYPPYMMFPMGGPFYMPPMHPDMPPDLHFQPQMMSMPFGYPPHPMMAPPMHHMNPNVAQFVPSSQQQKQVSAPSAPSGSSESLAEDSAIPPPVSPAKPTSRRLPIIDPVTGEEISIEPPPTKSAAQTSAPASALISADVAFGSGAPTRPGLIAAPLAAKKSTDEETLPTPIGSEVGGVKKVLKLKNVPIVKQAVAVTPVFSSDAQTPELGLVGVKKVLKGIKNMPLLKPESSIPVNVVVSESMSKPISAPRFKLTNKNLAVTAMPSSSTPSSSSSAMRAAAGGTRQSHLPIAREVFLQYLSLTRPDRNAPSSINVFPSELLGLRTAPHGDPGLSAASRSRRAQLQKTSSQVSMLQGGRGDWRSGKHASGGGRKTSGTGRGATVQHNEIIRPSERGFKVIDQSSLSEKDKLKRQVMSLLNKITVDSFGQITNQIAEIEILQPWQMDVVIGLIFDKAVVEHSYSEMYAEMCKKLRNTWPELTGVDQETGQSVPVTFARAIIEKCQCEFDNMPESLDATETDIAKVKGNAEDLEMLLQKRKERVLGNMKFIAQLFLMGILSSRVIRSVVNQLFFRPDHPEEHYIECVGILIHNIGSVIMETDRGRDYVEQFVERLQDLCARDDYGKRIKFMMQDEIDAAEAGWAGRHAGSRLVSAAKSKEAVRKDAQSELDRKQQPQQRQTFRPTAVLKRNTTTSARSSPPPVATSLLSRSSKKQLDQQKQQYDEEEWSEEESSTPTEEQDDDDEDEEDEEDGGEFTTVARH